MITLTFKVAGTDLRRTDNNKIVAVNRNNVIAKFEFNSDWGDITPIVVQFYKGDNYYDVNLIDGECAVPWEVLTSSGALGVTVTGGDLITTNTVNINIYGSGLSSSGLAPTVASPGVYTHIVELSKEIETNYNNIKSTMDTYNDTVNTSMSNITEAVANANESMVSSKESATEAESSATNALNALNDLKNTVINIHNSLEGAVANCCDASDQKIEALNIYGRSSQENVPTMTTPIEIKNAFENLNATIFIANKNLLYTPYTEESPLTLKATKDDYNEYNARYQFYIVEGVTYTFSYESDGTAGGTAGTDTVQAGLLDTTNNIHYMTTSNKYITFTAKKTGKCSFRCDVNKSGCTHSFWNFMCEVNNLKTNYADSEKQILEVALTEPLRAVPCSNDRDANIIINNIGYIADEICVQNGELGFLKRIANTRLTSAGFVEYTNSATDKKIYQKGLGTTYMYATAKNALCTHFKVDNKNYTVGDMYFPDRRVMVTVSSSYDLETFKQFLDENEVYIQLPLAEPIFTAFNEEIQTKFKALCTYYGVTNVYNNEGSDTKLNYVADTKLYIDNKIKEVATAIVATESEV